MCTRILWNLFVVRKKKYLLCSTWEHQSSCNNNNNNNNHNNNDNNNNRKYWCVENESYLLAIRLVESRILVVIMSKRLITVLWLATLYATFLIRLVNGIVLKLQLHNDFPYKLLTINFFLFPSLFLSLNFMVFNLVLFFLVAILIAAIQPKITTKPATWVPTCVYFVYKLINTLFLWNERGILMPNNSKSSANECKTGPFSLMRKLHEPKSFLLIPRNSVTNIMWP